MSHQTVHLLTNPKAKGGRGAVAAEAARSALRARGATVLDIAATTPYEAEQAAKHVVEAGAERLVVVGGDGMVHIAIQAVAESPTILGVIASGTGNDFAGALGLATGVDAAATAALAAPTSLDLMRLGDRFAASVATAGFSVKVNARANTMRFPRGASRYTVATLREIPALGARDLDITIDGVTHACRCTLVTVANTSDFGGGMRISPAAVPDDGLLEVTVVGECGRIELLRWFRKVFDGTHLDHPQVSTFQGRCITLSEAAGDVWADGEPVSRGQVTIEAVPNALLLAGL